MAHFPAHRRRVCLLGIFCLLPLLAGCDQLSSSLGGLSDYLPFLKPAATPAPVVIHRYIRHPHFIRHPPLGRIGAASVSLEPAIASSTLPIDQSLARNRAYDHWRIEGLKAIYAGQTEQAVADLRHALAIRNESDSERKDVAGRWLYLVLHASGSVGVNGQQDAVPSLPQLPDMGHH